MHFFGMGLAGRKAGEESGQEAGESTGTPISAGETLPEPPDTRGGWRMAAIVAGSAFFGGIAVVLWNRRTLVKMRNPTEPGAGEPGRAWED